MRRTIRRAIRPALVGLVCASLAGCSRKSEPDTATVVTVDVAPVLLSQIQRTIRAEGLIYPRQQAAIVPKISAPIKKAYVQRGARVRAGQLLLELENQDLAGAAAESRATFDQAQANFETAARATVPQEVQKAELDVRAARDAFDAQQAIYDSRERLLREGAIAEKDVNDARASS
ncbi:MAG: efflux RND transporter periplasmic adaptor subunit, partial [Acidobacteria bacterium]